MTTLKCFTVYSMYNSSCSELTSELSLCSLRFCASRYEAAGSLPTHLLLAQLFQFVLFPADQGRGDTHDQEHTKLCVESSRNASRKARVLSNYRHVLLRWAALAATNSHASTTASSSRNTQGRPTTTAHRGRRVASNSKGAADVPGTSPITPPVLLRSDLLSLKISDDVGRHLVARAARVSAGTLLLREHPYAWCLQPKLAGQLCAHCLFEVRSKHETIPVAP